jgi:transcriptional accessory protein Tex/SPT6
MQNILFALACVASSAWAWQDQPPAMALQSMLLHLNPIQHKQTQLAGSRHRQPVMPETRLDEGQPFTKEEFQSYFEGQEGVDWEARWAEAEPGPYIKSIEELQIGEEVDAKVKNIASFGVFCDIGAMQDALLHISEAGEGYIADLYDVYQPDQEFKARIKEIDVARGRLGLTVKTGEIKAKIPLSELQIDTEVTGTVKSVRDYGCFVDVGASSDGLLHISQAADYFVDDIYAIFSEGQEIKCRIQSVDLDSNRLSLTCKDPNAPPPGPRFDPDATPLDELVEGSEVEGTVKGMASFGVFVDIGARTDGFLHISEASDDFVDDLGALFEVGDKITCTIKEVDAGANRIGLSRKTPGAEGGGDDGYGGGGGGYDGDFDDGAY